MPANGPTPEAAVAAAVNAGQDPSREQWLALCTRVGELVTLVASQNAAQATADIAPAVALGEAMAKTDDGRSGTRIYQSIQIDAGVKGGQVAPRTLAALEAASLPKGTFPAIPDGMAVSQLEAVQKVVAKLPEDKRYVVEQMGRCLPKRDKDKPITLAKLVDLCRPAWRVMAQNTLAELLAVVEANAYERRNPQKAVRRLRLLRGVWANVRGEKVDDVPDIIVKRDAKAHRCPYCHSERHAPGECDERPGAVAGHSDDEDELGAHGPARPSESANARQSAAMTGAAKKKARRQNKRWN